jgi:hypothetical protein
LVGQFKIVYDLKDEKYCVYTNAFLQNLRYAAQKSAFVLVNALLNNLKNNYLVVATGFFAAIILLTIFTVSSIYKSVFISFNQF